MTTKDTTRFLHQPVKHYAAAHLQQGRPLLDSDFNESIRLAADDRRRALVDVIGGFGSPDEGFSLGGPLDFGDPERSVPSPLTFPLENLSTKVVTLGGASPTIPDVSIRPGSAFLGGMRFELEKPEHFAFQRDFLQMQAADVEPSDIGELYYLHAWEQCVTAVEDRELVEQALGGPDTMARIRRMRRVEKFGLISPHLTNCKEAFYTFVDLLENDNAIFDWTSGELRSRGRLQLQFQGGSDGNPCTPDPPPQYLGTENQTLRIMLTHPDHFVWAIDNGAPLYRVTVEGLNAGNPDNIRVKMLTPPRDEEHRPRENQVVELLPFAALVDREAPPAPGDPHFNKIATEIGFFTRVLGSFDARDNTFLVDGSLASREGTIAVEQARAAVHTWDDAHPARAHLEDEGDVRHFYMRLWHDAPSSDDVELHTADRLGNPVSPLGKTGITPFFVQAGRRGDYWTATLRVDQRGRIVPFNLLTDPEGEPPSGPRHFYMPVAYFRPPDFSDCRPRTRPLRDTGCETRTVGDGLKSIGDYPTIGAAIESLPIGGGRIVVRPGVYREEILLPSNVILDGCGDDTVLVSPVSPAQPALVRLAPGAENVKVRSFRIHAVEQVAIQTSSAARVELASLDIIAFTAAGTPGSGASEEPLIDVVSTNASSFRALRLVPSRRPALSVVSSNDIRVEGVSASTDRETAEAPAEPLVLFESIAGLRVSDVSLEAFGQVALHVVNSSNVTLARLEIFAGAHTDDAPAQTALDLENCTDLVFEDSHVVQEGSPTEWAAVAVVGNDLTLRRNRVRALPICFEEPAPEDPEACEDVLHVAWGGIHVRSGSQRIEISKNHIQGGLGHGVTLGSVVWGTDELSAIHREGPGKVLSFINPDGEPPEAFVHGDLSAGFELEGVQVFAFDETASVPTVDVLIAENRIEGMATNGISVLTVLGLAESETTTDLFEVQGLRIERNVITGNLRQLPSTTTTRNDVTPLSASNLTTPQDIPVLPYAGITLAAVTGGPTIANNQIVGNGTTETMPVCGIFILSGDAIVIARNRIIDNGGLASTSAPLQVGLRAGIAVLLSGSDRAENTDNLAAILLVQGDPRVEARTMNSADLAGEFALRILDNVVRQPEGRALHVISTGMISIDGNFLLSQGYHGALTPLDQLAIGDVVFVQGLGGAWETLNALDFQATGVDFNSLLAPNASHGWLSNNIGGSPRLYVGSGGGVLFHNNQVVYDWTVRVLPASVDDPLSFFPVVIIGQDHVGVIGNQFALRLQGADETQVGSGAPTLIPEIFLGNALVGGLTTQVARNRFAEPIESARISLVTAAEMLNVTSLNTGTHPTLAYRWKHPVSYLPPGTSSPPDVPQSFFAAKNPALFTRFGVDFQDLHNDLTGVIRTFFQLLNQRT